MALDAWHPITNTYTFFVGHSFIWVLSMSRSFLHFRHFNSFLQIPHLFISKGPHPSNEICLKHSISDLASGKLASFWVTSINLGYLHNLFSHAFKHFLISLRPPSNQYFNFTSLKVTSGPLWACSEWIWMTIFSVILTSLGNIIGLINWSS